MAFVQRWIGVCFLLAVTACASPAAKLYAQAEQLKLQPLELQGGAYRLTAFFKAGQPRNSRLHVYLEGDGRPWERGMWPASDPTTRASLMLPLLAMDTGPALYLGRPCYNGHAEDSGCEPRLWTSARYGEPVVSAMSDALEQFRASRGFQQLVLIGHSGGGSLAMLIAGRMSQTVAVVTLAGNYDIDAWADYHHYLRLRESINPAAQPATGVLEWHLLAGQDKTVPPDLFYKALQARTHSEVEVLPAIDHHDGWQSAWPQILNRLAEKQ